MGIKVFGKGEKGEPEDFKGGHTASSIEDAVRTLLGQGIVDDSPTLVVKLTVDDFDKVLNSDELWIVDFFCSMV